MRYYLLYEVAMTFEAAAGWVVRSELRFSSLLEDDKAGGLLEGRRYLEVMLTPLSSSP